MKSILGSTCIKHCLTETGLLMEGDTATHLFFAFYAHLSVIEMYR